MVSVVAERVDGRGVLRPHHEVRRRLAPAATSSASADGDVDVVLGDLAVVVEDVVAVARGRRPGPPRPSPRRRSSPCHGSATGTSRTSSQGGQRRAPPYAAAGRAPTTSQASSVPLSASTKLTPTVPTHGSASATGVSADGEGEPAPGHPAERPAAAPQLDRRPRGGHPERPQPVPVQHARSASRGGEEERLPGGEADPGGSGPTARIQKSSDELEADPEGQSWQPGAAGPQSAGSTARSRRRERDHTGRATGSKARESPTPQAQAARIRSSTSTTIPTGDPGGAVGSRKDPAPFGPARPPTGCRGEAVV